MKYNIGKLQNGGGFATFVPIMPNFPGAPASGSTGNAKAKSDDSSSIVDDKMLEHLYNQGGLVNDVNQLVTQINQLEKSADMPFLNQNNRATMLRLVGKINEVNQNKEYWKEAIGRAKESGGLGEVAVDNGRIYVKTKDNKIQAMSLKEYAGQRDRVNPLSVQELMYERQYNPNLTGQNGVFTVADNAIGINKITDHIKSLVSGLGTETDESSKYYSKELATQTIQSFGGKQPSKEELNGLIALNNVLQNDSDYSKVQLKTSSQRNQIGSALNYIWNTLGTPAQQKLSATAVINGVSDPKQFILDVLHNDTNFSTTREVTPVKTEDAKGITKQSGAEKEKPITPFELENNSKMGQSIINWNDPSTGLNMQLSGNNVGLWENMNDNTYLKTGLLETLLNSHTGALLEKNNVFFGDKKISPDDVQNIIVDPSSGSARVYFPVNGRGEPDYDLMKTIEELKKSAPHDSTPEQLTKYFAERGFDYVQFDHNFQLKPNSNFKPFLLAYGYADEKSASINGNKEIKELKGDESGVSKVLNRIWDKEKIKSPTGIFNWSNTYYKGNILIPYQDNSSILASSLAGNMLDNRPNLEDTRIHMNTDRARMISAPSNIWNTK